MTELSPAERLANYEALAARLNTNPIDADIVQAARGVIARAPDWAIDVAANTYCIFGASDAVLSELNKAAQAKGATTMLASPRTACHIIRKAQEISR